VTSGTTSVPSIRISVENNILILSCKVLKKEKSEKQKNKEKQERDKVKKK